MKKTNICSNSTLNQYYIGKKIRKDDSGFAKLTHIFYAKIKGAIKLIFCKGEGNFTDQIPGATHFELSMLIRCIFAENTRNHCALNIIIAYDKFSLILF